jgi:murein L,D-transpeptidase YafK
MALVATWRICATSGGLGPTRRKGDRQVPEGAYAIDQLNPWSTYHLSLHVNYPNKADRAAGRRLGITRLGGDVMVHGDCVTIGCIPIRDGPIEELYLAVLDANAHPPIHIFPARLEDANLARLLALHVEDDVQRLWRDELAPIYRAFERNRRLPKVSVDGQGRYVVE